MMRNLLKQARFPVIILVPIALYPLARAVMLDQSTTYSETTSNITVNYVLALYLYGVGADRLARRIGSRKAWAFWATGLVVIIMALRYVFGWEMRW